MLNTKMERNQPRGRPRTIWILDQIRKDIEMREENRMWENRDGWKFLCNSRPVSLETT
jgi:hypothetical protein